MSSLTCLATARVKIVPFSDEHLTPRYIGWLNDPATTRYSDQRFFQHTLESCRNYLNSFQGTGNGFWAILEQEENLGHVGTVTTYVNQRHGAAEIGILIGERNLWGKGYGTEVWRLMCQYLFDVVKVRKVSAGTLSVNDAMLKIMEKTGMVDDGVRVRECLYNGEEVDMVYKTLFREAWEKNQ